jgi:hypothetical protein
VVEASTEAEAMAAEVTGKSVPMQIQSYETESEIMRTTNLTTKATPRPKLSGMAAMAAFALLILACAQSSLAQELRPRTFSSPVEAAQALFHAVDSEDEQAVEAIVGAGKEVTSSSDEVEDKLEREHFCKKYNEMHRLVREPDGSTVLYIGAENWPFPIPLVSKNGAWYFDSETGTQEIKFRRIGENEATAIAVCEEFALGKNESDIKAASEDPITRFAQSLVSASVASAGAKGSDPFHGYYFRIVTGDSASGASDRGKKKGGLTLVAYPVEYQSSGVKTFVVTQRGVVFEKDLGPGTTTVAPQMKVRTGSNWHPAA